MAQITLSMEGRTELFLVTVVGVLLSVGHVAPDDVSAKNGSGSPLAPQGEGHVSNAQWGEPRDCVPCSVRLIYRVCKL